jgi:hypothetical protein
MSFRYGLQSRSQLERNPLIKQKEIIMIFNRENIYTIIKRKVEESLHQCNKEGRINEVILNAKEWSQFCKEYNGHDGRYSSRKMTIRFMVRKPIHVSICSDPSSSMAMETHDVDIICHELSENKNVF